MKTLLTGRGHYKSLTFDEAGQQIAFLSDQAEYDKPVSPVSPLPLEGRRDAAGAAELVVARATPGVPQGRCVVADAAAPRFSTRTAR